MSPSSREAPETPQDRQTLSLAWLKSVCRKGGLRNQQEPFWPSKYLYRPWTIYLTWLFAKLGVSANAVTFLSAVAIFAAAVLYGLSSPVCWLVGALCIQAYNVLDHVDGEVARYERTALGKHSGLSGHFCDTACHAGETALLVTLGMRLWVDLGTPWWLLLLVVIMLFPGHIAPWQRYCESLIKYAELTIKDDEARIPAEYLYVSSWAAPQLGTAERRPSSPLERVLSVAIQTIGFPGYWITLLVCTVLDVIPAVPSLTIAQQSIPYLLIWLAIRALHSAASALKSTVVYARRLRSLTPP